MSNIKQPCADALFSRTILRNLAFLIALSLILLIFVVRPGWAS